MKVNDMKLEMLPEKRGPVWAAYDDQNDEILWFYSNDDKARGMIWDQIDKVQDLNSYYVWRQGRKICMEATIYYHSEGHFSMQITDQSPDDAVRLMDRCGQMAS